MDHRTNKIVVRLMGMSPVHSRFKIYVNGGLINSGEGDIYLRNEEVMDFMDRLKPDAIRDMDLGYITLDDLRVEIERKSL